MPSKYDHNSYAKRVAGGERIVQVWLHDQTAGALKNAAKKDRRSLASFVVLVLEDWVRKYAENQAN